jgi:nucleoside phosphorylase
VADVILVVAATARELVQLPHADGLVCGWGPVEAAVAVSAALARSHPVAVVHVGIAGARRESEVELLDTVVGERAVYSDWGAEEPREIAADPALLAAAQRALPSARVLPIGTSARVGGGSCDVEAMEGYAVLRAAQVHGVPAVEVRVISNEVEEPDRKHWRFADAFAALGVLLPPLVEEVEACAR